MAKIRALIDPGINRRPNTRRAIDPDEISSPRDLVYAAKRFRKEITTFDSGVGRDLSESVANSTRGAVMSFAKTGSKNENSFHDGNGAGSLMDNCAGQSTLGRHEDVRSEEHTSELQSLA